MSEMRALSPATDSVEIIDPFIWRVPSFACLVAELRALHNCYHPLFRGFTDFSWRLDSTLARWVQRNLGNQGQSWKVSKSDVEAQYEDFARFAIYKFKHILKPSDALLKFSREHDMDPYFEIMKDLQQFPELYPRWLVDSGTPLMDWTQVPEVALFFSVSNSKGESLLAGQGCIHVFVKQFSGKTLINNKSVETLFEKWESALNEGENPGMPLIVCPNRQWLEDRPKIQDAIYLLQSDLRFPMDIMWMKKSQQVERQMYLKILVPASVKTDVWEYLAMNNVTVERLFPPVRPLLKVAST